MNRHRIHRLAALALSCAALAWQAAMAGPVMSGNHAAQPAIASIQMAGNPVANRYFLQDNGGPAQTPQFTPIPEPASVAIMAAGLGLLGFMARRRSARQAQK